MATLAEWFVSGEHHRETIEDRSLAQFHLGQSTGYLMHPCFLSEDQLLADCTTIRQRRSGPGGQHRNKVETAIRLEHRPSGLTAQASERRSQAENLKEALFRLRLELALNLRSNEPAATAEEVSTLWMSRVRTGRMAVNPGHADFPALLAEALDVLQRVDWDHKQAAERLRISPSQLLKLIKLEPRAWLLLNTRRQERGLHPLA